MDRTPPEVWTNISGYACTDSGVTGRQLSLVSKFIREASARVKLQSISIHGPQQIIAFHQLLLKTPAHLRQIRYLFLSTTPLSPTNGHGLAHSALPSAITKRDIRIDREEAKHSRNACQGVLAAVADCVEILYLDVRVDHLRHFPTTRFPRLAELASNGFPMVPNYSRAIPERNTAPCGPCPRLRRWHLMQLPQILRPQSGFTTIRTTAPMITHLRFSGLQQVSSLLSHIKAGLPETIQQVYVKPTGPAAGWCGTPRFFYGDLRGGLERLDHDLIDSRLVFLPKYKSGESAVTYLLSEWEERINGGDGCWSLCERVLTETNHSTVPQSSSK